MMRNLSVAMSSSLTSSITKWQMREPDIDPEDFDVIARQFEHCTGKYGILDRAFAGARWERDHTGELACVGYTLTKAATRRMLSQIDANRKLVGDRSLFVKKYLVRSTQTF